MSVVVFSPSGRRAESSWGCLCDSSTGSKAPKYIHLDIGGNKPKRASARVWVNHVGIRCIWCSRWSTRVSKIRELSGEDVWVRSTTEGNFLQSRSAGKPVHVPIPSHRIVWAVKCRVPPVWTPILLVHLSALTDGQNTRESVKLLSYQPLGASMMSGNVVLLSRQCNGRPP